MMGRWAATGPLQVPNNAEYPPHPHLSLYTTKKALRSLIPPRIVPFIPPSRVLHPPPQPHHTIRKREREKEMMTSPVLGNRMQLSSRLFVVLLCCPGPAPPKDAPSRIYLHHLHTHPSTSSSILLPPFLSSNLLLPPPPLLLHERNHLGDHGELLLPLLLSSSSSSSFSLSFRQGRRRGVVAVEAWPAAFAPLVWSGGWVGGWIGFKLIRFSRLE